MNEFDNNNNSDNNQSRPDYYQPTSGSTYYTPPQNENAQTNESTYHYSYAQQNNNSGYQADPSSYYQSSNYSENNASGDGKPPKKSKAAIAIVIILAVCLIVAVVAIVLDTKGLIGSSNSDTNNSTSQSQDASDTKLSDSEDVPMKNSDNTYTVAGVAANSMDSCVGISVYKQQDSSYYYFYGYGSNNDNSDEPTKSGEGSGVLMSEQNGKTYIITCAHVISDGDSFKVTLNDDTEYDAQMVGFDSQTDIGVLSIDKTGLKVADFANSSQLVVGEQVVAIGCPGGLEFKNSVTSGYISALDRPVASSIGYNTECIQTDTAINPGNSGGALFNMQGQVIGINSSKIASTEYEGMGFAVPSSTAIATANSLIKVGYVEGRAKIGITYNQISSFNNANTIINALAEKGYKDAAGTMVINEVTDNSDLKEKGIQQYDMIVAVNGETLTSIDVMTSTLSKSKPGDKVTLTIARIENNDINIKEVECTLIESKD
ncbi:MAG: trypsin-like peptidase domain-containing protein [Clostridium sp.]|nr:trypsin-like peptidase domain-containing protein [Clostridium sp.]